MSDYREPVKIVVDKDVSLTVADLNKVLVITDEKNSDFKNYASLEEVATEFGNNSKTYKAIETFLSQTDGSGNILTPDYFSILGVARELEEEDTTYIPKVKNEVLELIGESWYAILSIMDSAKLIEELIAITTSERRIHIAEVSSYPLENADKIKSERVLLIYNTLGQEEEENREYKSFAYAGTVITPGAGSKSSMVKLTGVTADVKGGKKQDLTNNNITFVEKRTSDGYIVANGGRTTEGTYLDEVTAIDMMIVNLNEAILKTMILKGFPQDDDGYTLMDTTLTSVMEELGKNNILAKENGQYEYKVIPTTQTKEERMQRIIRPRVIFRLKGWGYFVDLTIKKTESSVKDVK